MEVRFCAKYGSQTLTTFSCLQGHGTQYLEAHGTWKLLVTELITLLTTGVAHTRPVERTVSKAISAVPQVLHHDQPHTAQGFIL